MVLAASKIEWSIMAGFHPINFIYSIIQWVPDLIFSPTPPPPNARLSRPRVAIVGAGLTGVSGAAHCVGHGFDVTIFEAGDEKYLGGIWSVSCLHNSNPFDSC